MKLFSQKLLVQELICKMQSQNYIGNKRKAKRNNEDAIDLQSARNKSCYGQNWAKLFWKSNSRYVLLSFFILWFNSYFVLTNSQNVDPSGNVYTNVGPFCFYLRYPKKNFAEAYEDCRARLGGHLGVFRELYIIIHINKWLKNALGLSK